MSQRTYPQWSKTTDEHAGSPTSRESSAELLAARRLSDKASLLRPLQDEHLLEVYREAKKMNLSSEFIELLEEAIALRHLKHLQEA